MKAKGSIATGSGSIIGIPFLSRKTHVPGNNANRISSPVSLRAVLRRSFPSISGLNLPPGGSIRHFGKRAVLSLLLMRTIISIIPGEKIATVAVRITSDGESVDIKKLSL